MIEPFRPGEPFLDAGGRLDDRFRRKLNALRRAAIAAARSRLRPPSPGPEPAFWARITGRSGPAAAWTEVVPGTSTPPPGGGRSGSPTDRPAFEFNGVATPVGRVVELWPGPEGEYRYYDPGTRAASSGPLTLEVRGCYGQALPGSTVRCPQLDWSGTADARGRVAVPTREPGTYAGTIAHPRFADLAWSTLVGPGPASIVRSLAVAPGYQCFCGEAIPRPTSLRLVDPLYGAITLVYTPAVATWTAVRTASKPGRRRLPPPGGAWNAGCQVDAQVDVPIVYQLGCTTGPTPTLNVLFAECQMTHPYLEPPRLTDAPPDVQFLGWPLSPSGVTGLGSPSPSPGGPAVFQAQLTFPTRSGQILYPGGPHLFTVSEA